MLNMNKFFAGLGKAPIPGRGAYFPYANAHYTGTIERMLIADRSGSFVVEMNVETSTHPDVKPGDRRTWVQKTDDEDIALGTMAGFAMAMMGVNAGNKTELGTYQEYAEAFIAAGVSEDNPLCGETFDLMTVAAKTKKKGGDFTIHNWQIPANGKGPDVWTTALQEVLETMRAEREKHGAPVRPAVPPIKTAALRAAPPPPASVPWAGRPIQNGHYLAADNSAWIPLPPGAG